MPAPKDPPFTPRPQRTVQAGDPPNIPLRRPPPRAGNAPQTRVRERLGFINNDDMFLQEIKLFLKDYAPCENRLFVAKLLKMGGNSTGRSFQCTRVNQGKAGHEDEVFKPLKTIFDAILEQKDPSNEIHFELCPRTKIDRDLPGGNHLIDGCFMSQKYDLKSKDLCHRDIDIAMELKKHRNKADRDQSHRQILGASHHILSEDPQRMWIYGVAHNREELDDSLLFSRSHSVKTFAFDWFENVEIVIQIILSFVLATPAELGIDPLVHKGQAARDGKTWSYVYEVPESTTGGPPRFYKTGQGRIPERPMCIAGRVTRIWEVIEVDGRDGEKEICEEKCILKDVWLDANTQTEAENMDKIFTSVDEFVTMGLEAEIEEELKLNPDLVRDPATMDRLMAQFINKAKRFKCFNNDTKDRLRGHLTDRKYRSLFLTKRHAWRGKVSKMLGEDVLHCPTLFSKVPITTVRTGSQSATSESHYRDSYQAPEIEIITRPAKESAVRKDMLSNRRFVPKQQSRFVYNEVCARIDRLPTLGDAVDVLSEAVDALHILFLVGWVHRDISVGNILAVPAPSATAGRAFEWKVKLSDLEFSQVMVDKQRAPRSDPRTGTPFFMPTEVLSRRYLFQNYRIVNRTNFFATRAAQKAVAVQQAQDHRYNSTLADQVKKATDISYPHLKTFKTMLFDVGGMLEATDLDPSKVPSESEVVNHNFQHDLESIWWILLWFITQGIDNEKSSDWVDALFQHNVDQFHARLLTFDKPVEQHLLDYIPEDLVAGSFHELMEVLRQSMSDYYIFRPIYGQLDDPESYSEIYALFSEFLYKFKRDDDAPWRKLGLKHSSTLGLMQPSGSGVAPKRGRTRSMSRAAGSSKKRKYKD